LSRAETLRAQPLMRPYALLYFYRRRLRAHAVQELLAGLGVAIAVALVFASIVAAGSISGSAEEVVHAVIGPASLQLHARGSDGMPESMLGRVERLPGVRQAAPLLEQTATVSTPTGRSLTVELAGADTSLVVLDGLAHTLPRATLQAGGIGLSRQSAERLGISSTEPSHVLLKLRGQAIRLNVSAVLGPEAFGALSQASVAVMPLEELQHLANLRNRVSRVLLSTAHGRTAEVRQELSRLAQGRVDVAPASQDVSLLRQALRPSDQASAFFATVSGLLGVLLAFTALLLTVPERRRAIADLRLIGVKRSAIVQMLLFQALLLGALASLVGLAGGYLLSLHAFHRSTGYLAEAFTLGTQTVVGIQPVLLAAAGGILAACLASAVPLLDLRRGCSLDVVYHEDGLPAHGLPRRASRALALAAMCLLIPTSLVFAVRPSLALLACALLALAAMLVVPPAFAAVLRAAHALAQRFQRLTILPVALSSLRATALRPLALAATGAVALFGAIALGGARGDLLRGIERFAHSYSADASIWVGTPGDNQATVDFQPGGAAARIARLRGVAGVRLFQGGFMQLDGRRVWVIARPSSAEREVLASEILEGELPRTLGRLSHGGWIAVSRQIAADRHVGVGGTLALPTPSGERRFRVAATTTNLAWSPGVVFLGSGDYRRLWRSNLPTALGVDVVAGADVGHVRLQAQSVLGPHSGLRAVSAAQREKEIDALTSEGLGQLGEISTMLLIAAILAMAAALTSAIWQRRASLAALRLSGVRPRRLRAILAVEAGLMLSAGCLVGALAGVYGQLVIDAYLAHITGFPVIDLGARLRPLETLALLGALVMAIVFAPAWLASRVPPTLAFDE
jgi:putative ABC transport system permease protein